MSPFSPFFLDKDEVLLIHVDQIERYGGGLGVRDNGLLESAIAQPQATFGGQRLHPTLFEMAAAYLFRASASKFTGNTATLETGGICKR